MDNMLEIHTLAKASLNVVVHEFKASYATLAKKVYAFFEGKEDPSFYMNAIESIIPKTWSVRRWCIGTKEDVYAVLTQINQSGFNKDAVVFFVDRDLSDLLGEVYPAAPNIYVTDFYSIENELVDREMLERILREICGFGTVRGEDMEKTLCAFSVALAAFCRYLGVVMAWCVLCRVNDKRRPCMNNIKLRELIEVERGACALKVPPNMRAIVDHCEANCEVTTSATNNELERMKNAIIAAEPPHRHIRGKYLLWFLVEFTEAIYRDWKYHFPEMADQPKRHLQLGLNNAMEVIGPRARIPLSLREFLARTIGSYVASMS